MEAFVFFASGFGLAAALRVELDVELAAVFARDFFLVAAGFLATAVFALFPAVVFAEAFFDRAPFPLSGSNEFAAAEVSPICASFRSCDAIRFSILIPR